MKTVARAIATVGFVGLLRPAPGTWGSLVALPLFWALYALGGLALSLIAIVAVFALGLWATREATRGSADHDPSEIVIDEVAGQWIALLPLAIGAAHVGVPITALWPGWLAGFLAFRAFDIWKPGPVGWADRRHDALGVMMDDVIAGLLAAVVITILAALAHGVFL